MHAAFVDVSNAAWPLYPCTVNQVHDMGSTCKLALCSWQASKHHGSAPKQHFITRKEITRFTCSHGRMSHVTLAHMEGSHTSYLLTCCTTIVPTSTYLLPAQRYMASKLTCTFIPAHAGGCCLLCSAGSRNHSHHHNAIYHVPVLWVPTLLLNSWWQQQV